MARTMALRIAEPKLRGPRKLSPLNTIEHGHASSAHKPRPAQIYGMMLGWSPWIIMLRQQALLAQVFSHMIEGQLQFAQNWSLPTRQAARVVKR
jgi:hypothetical protein